MPIADIPKKNIWLSVADGDMAFVKRWCEIFGVKPDEKDHNGYTPIHAACAYRRYDILEYLVKFCNGNVKVADNEGDTPLFGCEEIEGIDILLLLGADPTIVNISGQNAADIINDEYPDVAKYLTREQIFAYLRLQYPINLKIFQV